MICMQRHCLTSTQVCRGAGVLPYPGFLDDITYFGQNPADRPAPDRADDQPLVPQPRLECSGYLRHSAAAKLLQACQQRS